MELGEFEINPIHIGLALVGGVISLMVAKGSGTGVFVKLLTFAVSTVACYFLVQFISRK